MDVIAEAPVRARKIYTKRTFGKTESSQIGRMKTGLNNGQSTISPSVPSFKVPRKNVITSVNAVQIRLRQRS